MTEPSQSAVTPINPRANQVLDFWFGAGTLRGQSRKEWFNKDANFDDQIRARFMPLYDEAALGNLSGWLNSAHECLALIVVLDQFSRNMFRDSHRAFAADNLARAATRNALSKGYDRVLSPVERMFIYLPLEHSEALPDQELCLSLMLEISQFAETHDMHVWAEKHRAIIERFGRFPHRNAALGRESTREEIEFLKLPASGF